MAFDTATQVLLRDATSVAAGSTQPGIARNKTYQAWGVTSAGAGAATIQVQGSLDGSSWDTIGTITLTLATTAASDSFQSLDRYHKLRGNVTAISGTGATVQLVAAY